MATTHNLNQDVTKQIFEVVGHLTIQWSMMEFSLDALIAILFHDFEGKSAHKELPRRFVDKTRFITAMIVNPHDALKPLSGELTSLVGRLGNLSQFRHDIIHGTLLRYEPETGDFVFITLDRTKDKLFHVTRERKMTALELLKVGAQAAEISGQLHHLVVKLLVVNHGPQELKELLDKFGMK